MILHVAETRNESSAWRKTQAMQFIKHAYSKQTGEHGIPGQKET